MSLEFWLLYTSTVFIASIIPGPSMLLALTQGIKHGAQKTIIGAMGIVTASIIQASISIAGLGAILMASESVFLIIKWLGAGYLIFMGILILRSKGSKLRIDHQKANGDQVPLTKLFTQAFMVAAGNPKAIIFFSALFPQFINPENAHGFQLFVLLSTLAIVAFICFMMYAIGGEKIVSFFSAEKFKHYINRTIGGTFIGVGIGLVLSD
jgi:homoserine/homoserine lactone efflux protein